MTASTDQAQQIHLTLSIELVQQLLSTLSLEQMQLVADLLQKAIHQKMVENQSNEPSNYREPAVTIDMVEEWEKEEIEEEDKEEISEEEFNRLVQEMS